MSRVVLFIVGVGSFACTGTETGNPFSSEASLAARTSDALVVGIGSGGDVVADSLWISVERVTLVPCDGALAPDPVLGPTVLDAIADGALLTAFATPSSPYCAVDVVLAPALEIPSGAPPELAGRALVLLGRAGATPFVAADGMGTTATLAAPTAIAFPAEGDGLVIAFDLVPWVQAIDPATLSAGPDGIARVDDTHSADRLASWHAAIVPATTAHRDPNRNGHVEAGEETPIAGH
jgi:hypothetical protein